MLDGLKEGNNGKKKNDGMKHEIRKEERKKDRRADVR